MELVVDKRETMKEQLLSHVATGDLPSLRKVLELLQYIDNLQHTIDEEYLPVEEIYSSLR